MEKGTLFIDLDGTVLHSETEEPLPFAIEVINKQYDEGFLIVLTTYRGKNWEPSNRFSQINTKRLLKTIGLKYHLVVWDSPSPRIIINDDVVEAIKHPTDASWEGYDDT